jgi:hypothetical protein
MNTLLRRSLLKAAGIVALSTAGEATRNRILVTNPEVLYGISKSG